MKTLKERFMELSNEQKVVAQNVIQELVVCMTVCRDHIIDKDTGEFDQLGTMINERVQSSAALLAALFKYNSGSEFMEGLMEFEK